MDEHARVNIAVCVDMQISASAGNAALHILSIILEIHSEQRLFCTKPADRMINIFSLLRGQQKIRRCIIANRHVVEEPNEVSAQVDQMVIESLVGNGLIICAGVASGDTVKQFLLLSSSIALTAF